VVHRVASVVHRVASVVHKEVVPRWVCGLYHGGYAGCTTAGMYGVCNTGGYVRGVQHGWVCAGTRAVCAGTRAVCAGYEGFC